MIDPVALAGTIQLLTIPLAALMVWIGWRSRSHYLALPELEAAPEAPLLSHAIVIPARNEAAVIARCVGSFPTSAVVVVDDHSTDATAALARQAGATVVRAPALPPHWTGKPNACWAGANSSSSDWIVFVDADTWYAPAFLPSLLSLAVRENLAAASVFPRQTRSTWWEHTLLPYAFGLYFTGVNARAVNNPHNPEALANGQCLLVSRKSYEFFGGHKAVAGSVIEDVELARLLKRHRMNGRVLRSESMASVRMYASFAALWRGFEKNSFRFLRANPKTGIQVMAASIVMTAWLPFLLLLLWLEIWDAAAIFFFVPALAWRRWYGSWLSALLAPAAIYLFQAIALSAMAKSLLGLTTLWKGRRV